MFLSFTLVDMMNIFSGVIIEESLTDTKVLNDVTIVRTDIEPTTHRHQTPHLKQWTLHTVEILPEKADVIAEELSRVLDGTTSTGYWYADFHNDAFKYIIFPDRIFKISRQNPGDIQEAKQYGISLGIPEYQVDFSTKW